jgi:dihydrodipicolinate synthase/N-acetylneuraminate lyase
VPDARLHGAIAAAVTPMKGPDREIDDAGIRRLTSFLARGGIDGVLTCGTTGEGILLSVDERCAVTEAFIEARPEGFQIAVHAGAQTTDDTVSLCAHAASAGTDAVAVIAPPYFPLDEDELFAHMRAAAGASQPLAFYVYEFAGRSGYSIPSTVIERLRDVAPNLRGLKVSDAPFEAVEPYMDLGLDVFIGQEPLVLRGLERGATGTVSGLASAWPGIVASLMHERSPDALDAVRELRDGLAGIPFHSALKETLVAHGVIDDPCVRAPLRALTDDEQISVARLDAAVTQSRPALRQAP